MKRVLSLLLVMIMLSGTNAFCVEAQGSLGETPQIQINNYAFIEGASSDTTATHSKEDIIKKYNDLIKPNGFLGHDTSDDIKPVYANGTYIAGQLSNQNIQESLNSVNMIRYLAGLDAVASDDSLNHIAQAGTVGLAACNILAHQIPQPSDMPNDFYALASKGVGSSNIACGFSNIPSSIVSGYMMDDERSNIDRVGHRRWILNPKMGKIGFGQTDSFTATYVFDQSHTQAAYHAVTWPAKGDFPIEYFSDYSGPDDAFYKKHLCTNPWSISLGSDYDRIAVDTVAVTITRASDGKVMTFNRDTNDDVSDLSQAYFNVNSANYGGMPCIIFKPAESDFGTYGDMIGETYAVMVTGLTKNNVAAELSYTVSFFELTAGLVDTRKADAVTAQIDALPAAAALTLNDKPAVQAARNAYDALTQAEKDLINADRLKKLTAAELQLVELQKNKISCRYQTHVQDFGWQDWQVDGAVGGTFSQSKRLEGICIYIDNSDGNIGVEYSTHVQDLGWQEMKKNGDISGTSAKSLRLEAINIKLTGKNADQYDIYYRVHAQNIGWMGWAKNGANAGTAGFAYRLEAIQIQVVPHGEAAPGTTDRPFVSNN